MYWLACLLLLLLLFDFHLLVIWVPHENWLRCHLDYRLTFKWTVTAPFIFIQPMKKNKAAPRDGQGRLGSSINWYCRFWFWALWYVCLCVPWTQTKSKLGCNKLAAKRVLKSLVESRGLVSKYKICCKPPQTQTKHSIGPIVVLHC